MNNCTLWPDRLLGVDWSSCCATHDLAYDGSIPRQAADYALYQCVAAQSPVMAVIMFCGVVAFGWLFYKKNRG